MVSYYLAFAPKSEAVKYMDYRATLKLCEIEDITQCKESEECFSLLKTCSQLYSVNEQKCTSGGYKAKIILLSFIVMKQTSSKNERKVLNIQVANYNARALK